ncbi:MAG: Ribosomal RNA small subunit methyltransferase H [Myxococcota bacterium]|nr:Ribosomal RNA small subunit methyltransferase H [Myxococcota bacterium]
MVSEVLHWLAVRPGGVYVDATLGYGGHGEAVLRASSPDGVLLGMDRDGEAISYSRGRLKTFGDRFRCRQGSYTDLPDFLASEGVNNVNGLLADFGLSSAQLDQPGRGFSFRHDAPLDMRFDQSAGVSAREYLSTADEEELARVLFEYGEVRGSRRIARAIVEARQRGAMNTTADLLRAVERVLKPPRKGMGVHPATLVFQAIRIAVNGELDAVRALLARLPEPLGPGGRAVFLTFHSLEDRMVKQRLRELSGRVPRDPWSSGEQAAPSMNELTRKPVGASAGEVRNNPRARSAWLRAAERLSPVEN